MPFLSKLAISALLLGRALAANGTGPIVDLGYVRYEGTVNATLGVTSYFGIRYAAPPVGDQRWRAPLSIEQHNNYNPAQLLDATIEGPECYQGVPAWRANASSDFAITQSEDCLLLDVLVPTRAVNSSLPVIIEIHGGGYTLGKSFRYPGYALVNQAAGNLIFVQIQYRLASHGWLSSAELRGNGVANAGLLDQRAAFEWVQRNIRAFGGDPAKVTIVGASAGGSSVTNHLIAYGGVANPPFRAAIAEYPWWQPMHSDTILEEQYRSLLTAANCTNLQCLRSLSSPALAVAQQKSFSNAYNATPPLYGYGDFFYGPSVDGTFIRDLPSNEFKQGHFSHVPLLTDREGYEGYLFSNLSMANGTAALQTDLSAVWPAATAPFFTRLFELYPSEAFNATFWRRQQIFGDFIINCPSYYISTALSSVGMPVYKMVFDAGSQEHTATQPFLYGLNANGMTTANNATLASMMKDWFISFVTNLDPNAVAFTNVSKPYWPQYMMPNETGFQVMDVNYTMVGVVADFDVSAQCDFFHSQSYIVRN